MIRCSMLHALRALDSRPIVTKQYHMFLAQIKDFVRNRLDLWAQFGGGHGGRVPPLFQTGGHNMACPPTFVSLGFVFGEVSKIKVMFATFCAKSFSYEMVGHIQPVHVETEFGVISLILLFYTF